MKRCSFVPLLFAAVLLGARVASADVVMLDAVKDNTLYETAGGTLSNGAGSHFFAGRTGQSSGSIRRGLIAFDIAGAVPAGSTINRVTLSLHVSMTSTFAAQDITLHRLLADWGEGTSNAPRGEGKGTTATAGDATWLHTMFNGSFWTNAGGDFVPGASGSALVAGAGTYTWDSTAGMVADTQMWLDTGDNFGWLLQGNESAGATAKRFDSRTNGVASFRPKLTVDFTPIPEPSTMALLIVGSWSVLRRRRSVLHRA